VGSELPYPLLLVAMRAASILQDERREPTLLWLMTEYRELHRNYGNLWAPVKVARLNHASTFGYMRRYADEFRLDSFWPILAHRRPEVDPCEHLIDTFSLARLVTSTR
jgi:hypothetical protein